MFISDLPISDRRKKELKGLERAKMAPYMGLLFLLLAGSKFAHPEPKLFLLLAMCILSGASYTLAPKKAKRRIFYLSASLLAVVVACNVFHAPSSVAALMFALGLLAFFYSLSLGREDWGDRYSTGRERSVGHSISATDQLKAQLSAIRHGNASIETYMAVASALGGHLEPRGFIIGMHYDIQLGNGASGKVEKFDDLQQWFLNNAIPVSDA